MAYGSLEKKKIKTKRISSSSILNTGKKERLVDHFAYVKDIKNRMSQHIFNHKEMLLQRISVEVLRSSLHIIKDGQYRPSLIGRKQLQMKLTALFEADNERQRLNEFSISETTFFRAG